MYSKKGKRKIMVDNVEYYWCLSQDIDSAPMPVSLTVLRGEGVFCMRQWDADTVPKSIAPALVREVIIAHIGNQTN